MLIIARRKSACTLISLILALVLFFPRMHFAHAAALPQETVPQMPETLSAGCNYTCRVKSDGRLACWGKNERGESSVPTDIFIQVSAGGFHTCGVKSDGALACWGENYSGQASPPPGVFTQVSVGWNHTCGVKSDGALACWGWNGSGQASPPPGAFVQVSAGDGHNCGIKSDGGLACWGDNYYGQVSSPPGAFTQVSAGDVHNCAVKIDGTLACWGYNEYGQASPPPGVFTRVSAGFANSCGLKSDGTLACWGDNEYGLASPPPGVFTQVSAGVNHTCAERIDGAFVCWGASFFGQTIENFLSPSSLPDGGANQPYSQTFTAGGENGPYDFSVTAGGLPPGLTLTADGLLSGAPTAAGEYPFVIQTVEHYGMSSGSTAYNLVISNTPPTGGDSSVVTQEDTPYTFAAADFPFSDPNTDAFGGVSILTLPTGGDLQCAGADVAVGELCADVSQLVFTPAANVNGSGAASLDFHVHDQYSLASLVSYSMQINISPVNDPPAVAAGPAQNAVEGQAVQFSGAFVDPDLHPPAVAAIDWDFGDANGAHGLLDPQHVFVQDGSYQVSLSVADELDATDTDWLTVTVANAPPVLAAAPDRETTAGQPLAAALHFSDPGLMDAHKVVVDWGAGQPETFNLAAGDYELSLEHVYAQPGTYTVVVTASDADGGQDSLTFAVVVKPVVHTIWLPVLIADF